ncbi:MAG: hypothetical protein D6B28_04860 [Gammaproteobacteria bacterium]|nr:MAG: hypothetical protein D6B28_04860 [Gammaproteobacteria bacterium]
MEKTDTNDAKATRFDPHGRVSFSFVEKNIIVYKAVGPFNQELIQASASIEPETLQKAKEAGKYWGAVLFENSCEATHKVFEEFTKYLLDMKKADMANVISAFVFPDEIECASFMVSSYEQCYKTAGLPFKAFKEYDEALLWIKSELAKLSD